MGRNPESPIGTRAAPTIASGVCRWPPGRFEQRLNEALATVLSEDRDFAVAFLKKVGSAPLPAPSTFDVTTQVHFGRPGRSGRGRSTDIQILVRCRDVVLVRVWCELKWDSKESPGQLRDQDAALQIASPQAKHSRLVVVVANQHDRILLEPSLSGLSTEALVLTWIEVKDLAVQILTRRSEASPKRGSPTPNSNDTLRDFVSWLSDASAHGRTPLVAHQLTEDEMRSPHLILKRIGAILREAALGAAPYVYTGSEPRSLGATAVTLDLGRSGGSSWIDDAKVLQRFVGCGVNAKGAAVLQVGVHEMHGPGYAPLSDETWVARAVAAGYVLRSLPTVRPARVICREWPLKTVFVPDTGVNNQAASIAAVIREYLPPLELLPA